MKKMPTAILPLLLTLSVILAAPYSSALAEDNTLTIAGTGDCQSLLRFLAAEFMERNPEHKIVIPDSIGSGGGIKGLLRNKFEMARTARPLKDKEQDGTIVEYPFALSPVVMATHPTVTGVASLNSSQILQIYSGEIKSWQQVGGLEEPIYPIDREPGDSSRSILEEKMSGFKETQSIAKIFYSTPEAVEAIAQNQNTLGYVPLEIASHNKLKVLAIDNVYPQPQSIIEGTYPYYSTFFLVTRDNISRTASEFLDFIYSEGSPLIQEKGLIPLERVD